MVQEIDDNIQALDEEIENVSATTEELAAGMEETAASSEEINAMSHEIESAAKSIATRSQDGATEADDIRDRAVGIKKTTTENDKRTKSIHAEINEGLTKALEDIKVVDQIGVLAESIMELQLRQRVQERQERDLQLLRMRSEYLPSSQRQQWYISRM